MYLVEGEARSGRCAGLSEVRLMASKLTTRGVKVMLTRAGVDHQGLTFTEQDETTRTVDFESPGPWVQQSTVTISGGSKAQRDAAWSVLFGAGLSCVPYSDRAVYARRAR